MGSAPKTLPADFFSDEKTPKTLPADFFSQQAQSAKPTSQLPDVPGFGTGLRESFGIPSWQQTKQFATNLYEKPGETLKGVYSDFDKVSKFAYDNPGKFLWAMTNMPMLKEAWDKGNYREALGILTGTGIQAASVVGEASKLTKIPFREGLTGKTAEALKAEDVAKATAKAQGRSETLKLTLGEKLGSPKLEKFEGYIRGMPGVGGRFGKIAKQRQELVFQFRDQMSSAADKLQTSAHGVYQKLEENVPHFADMQKARRDAYDLGRKLQNVGKDADARAEFMKADELSKDLDKLVQSSGDANTVAAWKHADKLWKESKAKEAVVDAIKGSTVGFDEPRPLARVKPASPQLRPLVENIKKLDEDGTLKRAIPNAQARDDLRTVADLYDRIQKKNSGYILMRIGGYAMLGTGILGAHLGSGYLAELAGGYLMFNTMAAMGESAAGTVRLKNFLQAVDKGELKRAETLAEGIAKSAEGKRAAEEALRAERQAAGDEQLRRFREMMGNQLVPAEPAGAPQVIPADNPPELNRYAALQSDLAMSKHLNEAIRRLSGTSKKPLNEQEIDWIGQQTGVDMTKPGAIGKARKALIEKRNQIRSVSK